MFSLPLSVWPGGVSPDGRLKAYYRLAFLLLKILMELRLTCLLCSTLGRRRCDFICWRRNRSSELSKPFQANEVRATTPDSRSALTDLLKGGLKKKQGIFLSYMVVGRGWPLISGRKIQVRSLYRGESVLKLS
ncbi:hypothetical protein VNO77_46309 [Canavalia gladiata]|uniref:Uncharacterized protein n=1 Tax=Canavalia gladiata TaxID=3824 RepID=A0AAN9JGT5_CANGL